MAFKAVDIELEFKGSAEDEVAINQATGEVVVRVNPKFYRPCEVELLIGEATKAQKELGWKPKSTLEELCAMMVEADLKRNESGFSF